MFFPCSIRTISPQIIFPQVTGQPAGSCPGRRQQNHPVAFFFPPGQIAYEHVKTVLIGVYVAYIKAELFLYLHAWKLLVKTGKHHCIRALKLCKNLCPCIEKLCLARKKISLFQAVDHAFTKFLLYSLALIL